MEDIGSDVFLVPRNEPPGTFVQHRQAGRIRGADLFVRIIHAGARVQVQVVAVDRDRAMSGIMRPDTGAGGKVE